MRDRLLARLRRRSTWIVGIPALIVAAALVGPYVWFNVIKDDPPPPLSFADITTTTVGDQGVSVTTALVTTTTGVTAATSVVAGKTVAAAPAGAPSPVEGSWRVLAGSVAGYRIGETVGVREGEAVGRTDQVTGAMTIANTTVTTGSWTVDMVSVKSDEERRDQQYRSKMEVDKYPTSTFKLSAPVNFGNVPAEEADITVAVKGALTLHGVTRAVELTLKARRQQGHIAVLGAIPVRFEDYNIENPSNGYARTDDHGLIEFVLVFEKA